MFAVSIRFFPHFELWGCFKNYQFGFYLTPFPLLRFFHEDALSERPA
jgi:hypothetical protein